MDPKSDCTSNKSYHVNVSYHMNYDSYDMTRVIWAGLYILYKIIGLL